MPYNEELATRIRGIIGIDPAVKEKKMFGGLAFLRNGHMTVGITRDDLMVRLGPDLHASLADAPHVRPMDFTGRPMKGFLFVAPEGIQTDEALAVWIEHSFAFTETLPPKKPKKAKPPKR